MDKSSFNLGLIVGILGTIAGVALLLTGQTFLGFFGTIASLGLAFQGYRDRNKK